MASLMLQFRHPGDAPSPREVRKLFDLETDELDKDFGVIATDPDAGLYTVLVATDPDAGLYTVLVDARAAPRVEAVLARRPHDPAEGLFGNTRIEPFGPPDT